MLIKVLQGFSFCEVSMEVSFRGLATFFVSHIPRSCKVFRLRESKEASDFYRENEFRFSVAWDLHRKKKGRDEKHTGRGGVLYSGIKAKITWLFVPAII